MNASLSPAQPVPRANLAWSLFLRASKALEDRIEAELAAAGQLSMTEMRVMYQLWQPSGHAVIPSEIADRFPTSRSNVSRVIKRLEDKGLVEKRQSPTDKRSTTLHLTEEGVDACSRGMLVVRQVQAQTFTGAMTEEQREELIEVLQSVLDLASSPNEPQGSHSIQRRRL